MHSDLGFFYAVILSATLGFLTGSFVSNLQGNHLQYGIELQAYVDERIAELDYRFEQMYQRYEDLDSKNRQE